MYDELVKRLKTATTLLVMNALCQEAADAIEELTGFVQEAERDRDEYRERLDKANDAIEELSAIREEQKAEIILMAAEDKPRWIPVTERLPEEYKDVLCYYEYFRFGEYNCMFRTIDRGNYGNGRWGGEAGHGFRNKVFAWMPLPQPPKEEKIS